MVVFHSYVIYQKVKKSPKPQVSQQGRLFWKHWRLFFQKAHLSNQPQRPPFKSTLDLAKHTNSKRVSYIYIIIYIYLCVRVKNCDLNACFCVYWWSMMSCPANPGQLIPKNAKIQDRPIWKSPSSGLTVPVHTTGDPSIRSHRRFFFLCLASLPKISRISSGSFKKIRLQ